MQKEIEAGRWRGQDKGGDADGGAAAGPAAKPVPKPYLSAQYREDAMRTTGEFLLRRSFRLGPVEKSRCRSPTCPHSTGRTPCAPQVGIIHYDGEIWDTGDGGILPVASNCKAACDSER